MQNKYNYISTFDMLKIGIGPSSSHTLGPWRAAEAFLKEIKENNIFQKVESLTVELRGSLSQTGKGHYTDLAAMLGLSGQDPEYIPVQDVRNIVNSIYVSKQLKLGNEFYITFDPDKNIIFNDEQYGFHPNGIIFTAQGKDITTYKSHFFSIGGGFIVKDEYDSGASDNEFKFPYEILTAENISDFCKRDNKSIYEIVLENEKIIRSQEKIDSELMRIWHTMLECIYIGAHTHGILEGGLNVKRRSPVIYERIKKNMKKDYEEGNLNSWLEALRSIELDFNKTLNLVDCYALAVNEVNASLGRVVTAPTNGSSGVIPATLLYYLSVYNKQAGEKEIKRFLLVAGVIGSLFKRHATISAAAGGCQAEIGVSSSMAAAALCDLMGGKTNQVLVAAEIAMEHHLGLTCDPVGGLVQIPCIERNCFGANKAIIASSLALETEPIESRVTLDEVIMTMGQTGKDMPSQYRESSKGGLAVYVKCGTICGRC